MEHDLVQITPELARGLVPLGRVRCEPLVQNALELSRDFRIELPERRDLRLLHQAYRLEIAFTEEEPATGQHLPQDDADRENVGTGIHGHALRRFRRQVAEFALDDPGLAALELAIGLGEAEIRNFHLPVAGDEDVRRGHIAMDDVQGLSLAVGELVRVGEALTDAHRDEARLLHRDRLAEGFAMLDHALEIGAVHELHHDEVRVVADADIEHLHAVRVREVRADARLVQEHADELLLLREMREHALDRDELLEALESGALRAEDLGHTARGDPLEDLVALGGLCHRRVSGHPTGCLLRSLGPGVRDGQAAPA